MTTIKQINNTRNNLEKAILNRNRLIDRYEAMGIIIDAKREELTKHINFSQHLIEEITRSDIAIKNLRYEISELLLRLQEEDQEIENQSFFDKAIGNTKKILKRTKKNNAADKEELL